MKWNDLSADTSEANSHNFNMRFRFYNPWYMVQAMGNDKEVLYWHEWSALQSVGDHDQGVEWQ